MQVWSNDRYESVEHRASVNSEQERFSIPYFFNPARRTAVEPLEEMVSEERPSRYNAYDWGEFFCTRRRSNFSKLDVDNIQIAHLRGRLVSKNFHPKNFTSPLNTYMKH